MRILIITPYYLPGFKAGGPVRSLANLIDKLGNEIDFRVIAGDRDLGDSQPYADIRCSTWHAIEKASVAYVPMSRLRPQRLGRLIREANCDALYLNSYFHPRVFVLPLALQAAGLVPRTPIVVAPRGAFSTGALSIKAWRKRVYLMASRVFALHERNLWHATSELEADDILRTIGPHSRIALAPNLCAADTQRLIARHVPKRPGQLRLAYLSRISPKKNLSGAIELLHRVSGSVSFDIYGPIDDSAYWQKCHAAIARLPPNVRACYRGLVAPSDVAPVLAQYDAMLLPTLGENFGHSIAESLGTGCPVVISNRTPWRNLQASCVGWDLPLESPGDFEQALSNLVAMDEPTHAMMRENCRAFVKRFLSQESAVNDSRRLFENAVGMTGNAFDGFHRRAA